MPLARVAGVEVPIDVLQQGEQLGFVVEAAFQKEYSSAIYRMNCAVELAKTLPAFSINSANLR